MNRDHQNDYNFPGPDPFDWRTKVGDSTPPATPVEPPDENWFQRQVRLAARDVQLLPPWLRSHPPAVSGEGERLKKFREHLKRGLIPMTDQTPDPWDYLAEFIEGNAVRPPGGQQVGPPRYPLVPSVAKELRGIVEAGKRALAAERAQHQQEIKRLKMMGLPQRVADLMTADAHADEDIIKGLSAELAQRDETIRQLQAEVQRQKDLVLAQTRLGSEAFERAHAAEAQIATLTQERDTLATRLALQVGDASELAMLGNMIEQWTRADAVQHGERWDSRALKAKRANELIHRVNAALEAAEARCATLTQELSVSRANHIDANQRNMQSVRELEAAEARCATLTAALKALYEVFDCESVAEGCEFGYQTCSAISEARAALSGVPAPESKPK